MSEQIGSETFVIAGYKGILVIGDPYIGAAGRIGRVDDAVEASFHKLQAAFALAKERNLVPLLIGDILHNAHGIGNLLPIIYLLSGSGCIVVPKHSRWQEQGQSHIAAILKATKVAQVAGLDMRKIQILDSSSTKGAKINITCHTSWGGVETLEFGSKAFLRIPEMNVAIMQGNTLPAIEGDDKGTRVVAGRLLRMGPSEESMRVQVFEITSDGVNGINLEVVPKVFTQASITAEETIDQLKAASVFVAKLRETTGQNLEEEGRESLINLIDDVTGDLKVDDWCKKLILEMVNTAQIGE